MTIRTILVPVADEDTAELAIKTGLGLAKQFGAHADVLHVRYDPSTAVPYVVGPMPTEMLVQISENAEKIAEERAGRLKAVFEKACAGSGVKVNDLPGRGATPCASWRELAGSLDFQAGVEGRVRDLAVVVRPGKDSSGMLNDVLEGLLFHSGRPVLMVPESVPEVIGQTVVVAWNGGIEATRAVAAAMPFLEAAKRVVALTVGDDPIDGPGGDDLAHGLGWHGISVDAVQTGENGRSEGETLLATARSLNADLLVMGAYSHSRLRELILGGATWDVINSADIPVLLIH